MSTTRRNMMAAGRRAAVDWETLFMGLVDGSLSGEITLPDVTSFRTSAFDGCTGVTGINAPNVTSVRDYACRDMYSLKNLNIGVLQSIGYYAFSNCRSLETPVILGNEVTSLTMTFFNCYKIPYIDVGSGVTNISNQCFRYLTNCQYIIMRPTTPPILGTLNFENAGQNPATYPIYVPDESVADYKAANNWSALADRIKPLSELGGGKRLVFNWLCGASVERSAA